MTQIGATEIKKLFMHYRKFITTIVFQLMLYNALGQNIGELSYRPWHHLDSLKLDFLVIRTTDDTSKPCELHFLIKLSGEAFTKKHRHLAKSFLNLCVKNYMFNDTWIDTTYGTTSQLQFMQAQFDLAESYARKLRKALYENGHATNKFVRTTQKAMLTECKKEFNRLENETLYGRNKEALKKWQIYIASNLKNLAEYESSERATFLPK